MNQEYVELYVCPEIEKYIEEKVLTVTGVNRRIYKNQLLFIVSRIHWKHIHHPQDFRNNGARLRTHVNASDLRRNPDAQIGTLVWYLSSKGGKVTNMLKTLNEWGIIEPKNEPVIGVSARTYTFKEQFESPSATLRKFYIKDGAFVKNSLREHIERLKHPLVGSVLNIYQKDVSISEAGLKFIESLFGDISVVADMVEAHRSGCFEDNRETLLEAFANVKIRPEHERLIKIFKKEFYASVGKRNGRLDHNLTNLEREYRKFILIDGKPMLEVDIVNSQPTIAVALIKKQLKTMFGAQEFADVLEMERYCGNGQFYEVVANAAGIKVSTPEARNNFKKNRFFPEVFFCENNTWNTPTQIAFKSLFPNADLAIREIKSKDHRAFAVELQKLESDVMIFTVFTRLIAEGYRVLPLHDAIYCNDASTREYAEHLIQSAFRDKYNVCVAFKRKNNESERKGLELCTLEWSDDERFSSFQDKVRFLGLKRNFERCPIDLLRKLMAKEWELVSYKLSA